VYDAVGAESALMITEGLLMYLPAATVDALAAESRKSSIAHWISDISTTAFATALGGADALKSIKHVQAPDAMRGEQILEVLEHHGWTSASARSYISDVGFIRERILRSTGGVEPPRPNFSPGDPTGVIRFGRSGQ
jgi:O-methyltransferase involved in polyketide biosynthesis